MSVTQVEISSSAGPPAGASVAEAAESPPVPASSWGKSLRARAQTASLWSTGGFVITQGIRLFSNVVIAKYVAPQVLGLVTMASTFLLALQMFSDVGLGPNIIHNKNGDDPEFYNTAWTMQVIRGFVLFLLSCAGAYPVALFFEQPILLWVIPACGFSSIVLGFHSTSLTLMNRELQMKQATLIDVAAHVLLFCVTYLWAKHHPTVWALVAGTTATYVFRSVVSHFVLAGHVNRFRWNREHARAMISFGKWVFLSTALLFFVAQADKIMQGKLAGPEVLGVYGIAVGFIGVAPTLIKRLSNVVVFPVLSTVVRERPQDLGPVFRKMRLAMLGVALVIILPLILGGRHLIEFLYEKPYWDAGWMLQYLSAGAMVTAVCCTIGSVFFALGHTHVNTILMVTHLLLLISCGLGGYALGGNYGFIIGVSLVELFNYPMYAYFLARRKLWHPELDLPMFAIAGAALYVGLTWM